MTAPDSLPLYALTEDNLAAANPDLLRAMVKRSPTHSCPPKPTRCATPSTGRSPTNASTTGRWTPARTRSSGSTP
jgi:hypothetical protein